ncbi:MAG TPA: glutamate synthase [Micromonosporaceae bacterium]|nr:glutamate synthase [Micromonosporaceae bacterium]
MPDPNGFLRFERRMPARRPVPVRIQDWQEVYPPAADSLVQEQATRCMDCGIPFCHDGCPLGNRIPDWNDLVRGGSWDLALESLHATNNFPEFTGRLCPAPCEASCVLGISGGQPVTIKQVEVAIADRASFEAQPAPAMSGRSVAIVGSGPAGLAAAQQLARAGHDVTVYERDDAIGGLLRYGIPDFKLEKHHIDRRAAQLSAEGVQFRTGVNVTSVAELRESHDAVLLATGALRGRDVNTAGRELDGVHLAMEHLTQSNRFVAFGETPTITAAGKHVIIIGGGDTGSSDLGVAHRQGAATVTQLDRYPLPPSDRLEERDPWPTWPWILRSYPAHEEGGARVFAVAVEEFIGDGTKVTGVRLTDVLVENRVATPVPGTSRVIEADLVLLAIGFEGTDPLLPLSGRGTVPCGPDWQTDADGVFVAGDAHRGASLIVWAIAEGRAAAASIHAYLGGAGSLPAPVTPSSRPLVAA